MLPVRRAPGGVGWRRRQSDQHRRRLGLPDSRPQGELVHRHRHRLAGRLRLHQHHPRAAAARRGRGAPAHRGDDDVAFDRRLAVPRRRGGRSGGDGGVGGVGRRRHARRGEDGAVGSAAGPEDPRPLLARAQVDGVVARERIGWASRPRAGAHREDGAAVWRRADVDVEEERGGGGRGPHCCHDLCTAAYSCKTSEEQLLSCSTNRDYISSSFGCFIPVMSFCNYMPHIFFFPSFFKIWAYHSLCSATAAWLIYLFVIEAMPTDEQLSIVIYYSTNLSHVYRLVETWILYGILKMYNKFIYDLYLISSSMLSLNNWFIFFADNYFYRFIR